MAVLFINNTTYCKCMPVDPAGVKVRLAFLRPQATSSWSYRSTVEGSCSNSDGTCIGASAGSDIFERTCGGFLVSAPKQKVQALDLERKNWEEIKSYSFIGNQLSINDFDPKISVLPPGYQITYGCLSGCDTSTDPNPDPCGGGGGYSGYCPGCECSIDDCNLTFEYVKGPCTNLKSYITSAGFVPEPRVMYFPNGSEISIFEEQKTISYTKRTYNPGTGTCGSWQESDGYEDTAVSLSVDNTDIVHIEDFKLEPRFIDCAGYASFKLITEALSTEQRVISTGAVKITTGMGICQFFENTSQMPAISFQTATGETQTDNTICVIDDESGEEIESPVFKVQVDVPSA